MTAARGLRAGPRPAPPPPVRLVLATLVCALLALLVLPTPRGHATEPDALASITLTSVSPSLPQRDGSITLSGRVTNTSKERIIRPQAIFWRNQAPITSTDGLDQALGSDSNDPIGARFTSVFQDLYTADQPYLAPGKSASFTLTVPVGDLALAPTEGVFLMGVHVLQNGVNVAVARTRVLVPVLSEQPKQRSTVTSVVVLATRPAQIAPGLLSDDHLAGEVGPTGRLTRLLARARDDATSFAVDPDLVAELETMRDGYEVRTTEGGTTPGTGRDAAARWLADLTTLKADHDGYRLLFGSPDVAALAHARQTDVLAAAAAAGRSVELTADLPLLVLPTGGAADEQTVQAAEALDPRAVLLADSATGGAGPVLQGPDGDVPVLTYAASALGGGPGPDPSDNRAHIQQRVLATSWIEAAAGTPQAQIRLIRSSAQAASTTDRSDPPWVEPTPLSTLLARTPADWSQRFRYPSSASDAELDADQLDSLARLADSQQTWQDLLVDADAETRAGDAMLARAASGAWRGHEGARNAVVAPQQASLDERLDDKIRISSTRKVSTVSQEGVEFPITIRNELAPAGPEGVAVDPNSVRVRLGFASDNRSRLVIKPITADLIRPENGFTANAEVTARANGTVPVVAQLYTVSGRKVGRPVEIEVQVTQNGTTGWAIAIAAGLVLIGSTSWRIRQVTRERARTAAAEAAGPEPVSALTSAPPAEVDPERRDEQPTVGG